MIALWSTQIHLVFVSTTFVSKDIIAILTENLQKLVFSFPYKIVQMFEIIARDIKHRYQNIRTRVSLQIYRKQTDTRLIRMVQFKIMF